MGFVELLNANSLVLITLAMVLGLIVGSFLNVVIYRLPVMLQRDWKSQCCEYLELNEKTVGADKTGTAEYKTFNLAKPDSHCPHCKHKVRIWENIPILSYMFLGGRCSSCKKSISLRYPSIELLTGILTTLVVFQFGAAWLTLALLLFTWSLLVLTLIDFDHQLLPDDITLPLLWLGLLVNSVGSGMGISLQDAVIGAMAGYLSLWSVYWAFKLTTGKEGMGHGDFKLLAALGAWMGWQALLPIIILSSVVGAIAGISIILVMGRDKSLPMPFGPYLAGAGFIMLIWGPQVTTIYQNLLVY